MPDPSITCPRCQYSGPLAEDARFCPRCGLADVRAAAMDSSPVEITTERSTYRVLDRLAFGEIANIHRCTFCVDGGNCEGVLKIARDARSNKLLRDEAHVLTRLHSADYDGRFEPFLPVIEESFAYRDDPSSEPRQANVLRMHPEIRSPDELYTLADVRRQYPAGLDPRDMAWIWRRLLSILGYVHSQVVVHGAVLPPHVLVEPRDHKLVLIDWCWAKSDLPRRAPVHPPVGGYGPWYAQAQGTRRALTPALDLSLGARCMIELMGGDPIIPVFPPKLHRRLREFFQSCISIQPGAALPHAWDRLELFDQVIGSLWGPRQYRELPMPPRK